MRVLAVLISNRQNGRVSPALQSSILLLLIRRQRGMKRAVSRSVWCKWTSRVNPVDLLVRLHCANPIGALPLVSSSNAGNQSFGGQWCPTSLSVTGTQITLWASHGQIVD